MITFYGVNYCPTANSRFSVNCTVTCYFDESGFDSLRTTPTCSNVTITCSNVTILRVNRVQRTWHGATLAAPLPSSLNSESRESSFRNGDRENICTLLFAVSTRALAFSGFSFGSGKGSFVSFAQFFSSFNAVTPGTFLFFRNSRLCGCKRE